MQDAWHGTWGSNKGTTMEQELRLAQGRFLVPGVCVRHKIHKFRAVILGCEPFVRAPLVKRLSERERRPRGGMSFRMQPIYCCMVDERDVPEGGAVCVPERDLEPAPEAYPVASRYVDQLFDAQDCLSGYTPGKLIRQAMARQAVGMPFILKEDEEDSSS
uniref:Hemimethylated DNA-binding domain-containing protein n=2 Tax=Zooxanthella nutricula TaxID=1333877 RepID=A0A7S2ND29_9DINO